jgi:hypothetical protein
MRIVPLTAFCLVIGLGSVFAEDPVFILEPIDAVGEVTTQRHLPEGCCVLDVNGDGRLDVVSGPNWYEAPGWTPHHLRDCKKSGEYHADFGEFAMDINGDGLVDIVTGQWHNNPLVWYENPGAVGKEWPMHVIVQMKGGESFLAADVDRDGDLDILPSFYSKTPVFWLEKRGSQFVKHPVGEAHDRHGIGFGDVDGDGRGDIVTSHGWYRAPEDPRTGQWEWFPEYDVGGEGCIPMIVTDVNGDGRSDIIVGRGHDYGLAWFEQKVAPAGRTWTRHVIDDTASQFHTMVMADVDGDGALDLVTGKRYRGHNGGDPGADDPQGVYWYRIDRKTAQFERHVLAYNARAGVGMNIVPCDIDKDGDIDIVIPGKSGVYLLRNVGHPKAKSQ